MYLGSNSRALIEQNWARLELRVKVFCLRVSVLSVYAAKKASDLAAQTLRLRRPCTVSASILAERD